MPEKSWLRRLRRSAIPGLERKRTCPYFVRLTLLYLGNRSAAGAGDEPFTATDRSAATATKGAGVGIAAAQSVS
jgi:hypothetical protein